MPWTTANTAAPASPMNAIAGPVRRQRRLLHLSGCATCGIGPAAPQTPKTKKNCDLIIYGGGRLGVSTFKNDLTLYSKIIFLAVGVELNLCGGARRRILFYRSHVRWGDVSWDGCEQVSRTIGSDKKWKKILFSLRIRYRFLRFSGYNLICIFL